MTRIEKIERIIEIMEILDDPALKAEIQRISEVRQVHHPTTETKPETSRFGRS